MKKTARPTILFISVILFALAIKLLAFDVLWVSGPSMLPTLRAGMPVCEFKLAWGVPIPFSNRYALRWGSPKPGEIVIYPVAGRYVVKRCVAPAGTPLFFSAERGYSVSVGGRTIPLDEEQYRNLKDALVVPTGMIFAIGDNMAESRDSRDYGFVSIDSIRGKALCR